MDSLNLSLYFTTIQCSKVKTHVSLFFTSRYIYIIPVSIYLGIGQLKFFLLHPDVAKSLHSQFSFSILRQPTGQRLSNVRTQQTKISIGPILFLCYMERMVSSNLNSKQLRFQGAHPNLLTTLVITAST